MVKDSRGYSVTLGQKKKCDMEIKSNGEIDGKKRALKFVTSELLSVVSTSVTEN